MYSISHLVMLQKAEEILFIVLLQNLENRINTTMFLIWNSIEINDLISNSYLKFFKSTAHAHAHAHAQAQTHANRYLHICIYANTNNTYNMHTNLHKM